MLGRTGQRLVLLAVFAAALTGPGAQAAPPGGTLLAYGGVSLRLPAGWTGRVLYLDPKGSAFILQAASFALPRQPRFGPPPELPPGSEDRIKAMHGRDVLLTLETVGSGGGRGPSEQLALSRADFVRAGSRGVPRGHVLARRLFCIHGRCFVVEVDFARAPVEARLLRQADGVLASLVVRGR